MDLGVPAITEMVLIGVPSRLSTTQKLAFGRKDALLEVLPGRSAQNTFKHQDKRARRAVSGLQSYAVDFHSLG